MIGQTGIRQIIEVCNLSRVKVNKGKTVTEARIEATHDISRARGVKFSTIEDKYIRGLDNTINGNIGLKGVESFDKALEDALNGNNTVLRDVLLSRTDDRSLRNYIVSSI